MHPAAIVTIAVASVVTLTVGVYWFLTQKRPHADHQSQTTKENRPPKREHNNAARRRRKQKLDCMIIPSYGKCPHQLRGVGEDLDIIQQSIARDKSLQLVLVRPNVCDIKMTIESCKARIQEVMITTQEKKTHSGRKFIYYWVTL